PMVESCIFVFGRQAIPPRIGFDPLCQICDRDVSEFGRNLETSGSFFAITAGTLQCVTELFDQQLHRRVQKPLYVLAAGIRKVFTFGRFEFPAKPTIWLAGVGMDAIGDPLLSVAKDLDLGIFVAETFAIRPDERAGYLLERFVRAQ